MDSGHSRIQKIGVPVALQHRRNRISARVCCRARRGERKCYGEVESCTVWSSSLIFTDWRAMADPVGIEITVLQDAGNRRNTVLHGGLANPLLFSAQGKNSLAEEICSGQKAVDDVLGKYYGSAQSQNWREGHCGFSGENRV